MAVDSWGLAARSPRADAWNKIVAIHATGGTSQLLHSRTRTHDPTQYGLVGALVDSRTKYQVIHERSVKYCKPEYTVKQLT